MGTTTVSPDPQPAERGGRPGRRALYAFAGAAVAVPLLWALYTGHVWEDYFITFKHSQNLADGQGLVYRPGERVHGFTSPLGTLLPALCYLATGRGSYLPGLWLFRALSALAFAGGGVLFLKALRCGGAGPWVRVAFAALYLLNPSGVDFTVNGMETGFMLLFVGWGVYLLARDEPRDWWALGLCAAGLMWTRPDGCVYIAAFSAASLLFATGPRRPRLVAWIKAGALCAALYAPWVLWAWGYYGSPVPNTIRAKAGYRTGYPNVWETLLHTLKRFPDPDGALFRPAYADPGSWPSWLTQLCPYLVALCAAYWLLPVKDRFGRLCSFCFAALALYLSFLVVAFPWYVPPVAVFGLLLLPLAASTYVKAFAAGRRLARCAVTAGLLLLLAGQLWLFVAVARQMKAQQELIEWGNRVPVARWLQEHTAPGDRVYAECLGYIGYFSGAKMLDYPGLASPEVVEAMRAGPTTDFASVGLRLRPEWIVVRPRERAAMAKHPEFAEHYKLVTRFDVSDRLASLGDFPGKGYLSYDVVFEVYKRDPQGS